MDELGRVLRAWEDMVDPCDAITRLTRQIGIERSDLRTMANLKLPRDELTQRTWRVEFLDGLSAISDYLYNLMQPRILTRPNGDCGELSANTCAIRSDLLLTKLNS